MKKKNKEKKKLHFRLPVHPRCSPQYFDVYIYKTRDLLRAAHDAHNPEIEAFFRPDNSQVVITITSKGEEEAAQGIPKMGELHFYKDGLTLCAVVHELFHAVLFWARVNGCFPKLAPTKPFYASTGPLPDAEELCASNIDVLLYWFLKECPVKITK